MSRDDATLLDIVNAARLIQTFIQEMPKEAFLVDLKTQSAVLYQVTVIGEAVKRLSEAFPGAASCPAMAADGGDARPTHSRLRCH